MRMPGQRKYSFGNWSPYMRFRQGGLQGFPLCHTESWTFPIPVQIYTHLFVSRTTAPKFLVRDQNHISACKEETVLSSPPGTCLPGVIRPRGGILQLPHCWPVKPGAACPPARQMLFQPFSVFIISGRKWPKWSVASGTAPLPIALTFNIFIQLFQALFRHVRI